MGSWSAEAASESVSLRRDAAASLAAQLRDELTVEQVFVDTAVICGGGQSGDNEVVRCHRMALAALSPMMRAAISQSNCRESDLVILAPEADGRALALFLAGVFQGGFDDEQEITLDQDLIEMFGFHQSYDEWQKKFGRQTKRMTSQTSDSHSVPRQRRLFKVEASGTDFDDSYVALDDEHGYDTGGFIGGDTDVVMEEEGSNKSVVWEYFRKIDKEQAECVQCGVIFRIKGGTTTGLRRHIMRNHSQTGDNVHLRLLRTSRKSYQKKKMDEDGKKSGGIVHCFKRTNTNVLQCLSCKDEVEVGDASTKEAAMWSHLEEKHADSVESGVTPVELTPLMTAPGSAKQEDDDYFGDGWDNAGKKRRKEKTKTRWSTVWNYFQPTELPEVYSCSLCNKRYSMHHCNTSNIRRHLKTCHKVQFQEMLSLTPSRPTRTPKESTDDAGDNEGDEEDDAKPPKKKFQAGDRPFTCEECGRSFARVSSLRNHTHDPQPSEFLCSLCGKTFTKKYRRDVHEKAHMGEAPFKCNYCEKRFVTGQQRQNHERIHTGERPFHCTHCGKQFTTKDKLTTHLRVHTGETPYGCEYCPQRFRYLSTRNKHSCEGKRQADALKLLSCSRK